MTLADMIRLRQHWSGPPGREVHFGPPHRVHLLGQHARPSLDKRPEQLGLSVGVSVVSSSCGVVGDGEKEEEDEDDDDDVVVDVVDADGCFVGFKVGLTVGFPVGSSVGNGVGMGVGGLVGGGEGVEAMGWVGVIDAACASSTMRTGARHESPPKVTPCARRNPVPRNKNDNGIPGTQPLRLIACFTSAVKSGVL